MFTAVLFHNTEEEKWRHSSAHQQENGKKPTMTYSYKRILSNKGE